MPRMTQGLRSIFFLFVAFALTSGAPKQEHTELCDGFVAKNELKIPVGGTEKNRSLFRAKFGSTLAGGLTEQQFNSVIDRAYQIYAPVIQAKGKNLRVNRLWTDDTVNASAEQFGRSWVVNMFGGLARHPAITEEGFAIVICHELGHHLGGAPKVSGIFGSWATNEGGSDYFAGLKCLRYYYDSMDNEAWYAANQHDAFAEQSCQRQHLNRKDQLICLRIAAGGQSVANFFKDLRSETTAARFDTPDPSVVQVTDDSHPGTQCRMDTYFAAALCQVDKSVALSDTNARVGSCNEGTDLFGWRPRCWFKPE